MEEGLGRTHWPLHVLRAWARVTHASVNKPPQASPLYLPQIYIGWISGLSFQSPCFVDFYWTARRDPQRFIKLEKEYFYEMKTCVTWLFTPGR